MPCPSGRSFRDRQIAPPYPPPQTGRDREHPPPRAGEGWEGSTAAVKFVSESSIGSAVRSSVQGATAGRGIRGCPHPLSPVSGGGVKSTLARLRRGWGLEAGQGQRMPDVIRTAGIAYLSEQWKRSALPLAVLTALSILAAPALAQSGDPLARRLSLAE